MSEYVRDWEATTERVEMLFDAVRYAEYELVTSIALLRAAGKSWDELAGPMGFANRSGAYRWFSRRDTGTLLSGIDEAERERLGRLLKLGRKADRWEVRVIIEGRPGITAVKRQTLSRHLERAKAVEACRRRGDDAELWRVEANGKATRVKFATKRAASTKAGQPAEGWSDF